MVEATWLFPQHVGLLVAVDVVEFWLVFSSALFLFMSYLPPRISLGQVAARGYTEGLAVGEASGHAAFSLLNAGYGILTVARPSISPDG